MAPRHQKVKVRIEGLITKFPHYLRIFEMQKSFSQYGKMEFHMKTISLLKEIGSVANALKSQEYTGALYQTLIAWGLNSRGAKLKPLSEFREILALNANEISALEPLSLCECQKPDALAQKLWRVISDLEVTENQSRLVAGTKTLHHLLPNLIPPVDRTYTRVFFQWYGQMFHYQESKFLEDVFPYFIAISHNTALDKYVTGKGWRTSPTKLIDNAIIGYCVENKLKLA